MTPLDKFGIRNVSRRLNGINADISVTNNVLFPCLVLLSNYSFKKRFVKILPNGDIQGGFTKMIISLIDFAFIRSLTASCYSIKSPPAYDPPSLFLLEMFRYIDRHQNMDRFLEVLRDENRGRAYRSYAGIVPDKIPTKGTFSNFKARLGERLYNEIFHILVHIFHELQLITFKMIAHDGSLFPTRARYKGCTWFSKQCTCIQINDIVPRVRQQILYRLNNLNKVNLEKIFKIKCECPYVPEGSKNKPFKMEVLSIKLQGIDGPLSENQINTARLFGVKEDLDRQGLCLNVLRSNLTEVNLCDGGVTFCCPRIPKDTDARIGVRRDPKNPSKKQKIFGYNVVLSTSVELDLKLELPVAVTNISGNGDEGRKIITNAQQIKTHHDCRTIIDIADAKYDTTENYAFLRQNGSFPIIDYNCRNEKLTADALRNRGYDQNGWPFAPCGISTRPNGFDKKHQRHTFCCFKQCLDMKAAGIKNILKNYDMGSCAYIRNKNGFSKHTYIKDHPRLLNEILRGTKRFKIIKQCRSASERANSTIKDDLKIIDKPIVYCKKRADILAQIAAIVLLLQRAFAFIVRISILVQQYLASKDPGIAKKLQPHDVPESIRSLIQRE